MQRALNEVGPAAFLAAEILVDEGIFLAPELMVHSHSGHVATINTITGMFLTHDLFQSIYPLIGAPSGSGAGSTARISFNVDADSHAGGQLCLPQDRFTDKNDSCLLDLVNQLPLLLGTSTPFTTEVSWFARSRAALSK